MDVLKKKKFWLGLIVIATFVLAVILVVGQQAYRLGANEPQRSMAQDIVMELDRGRKPTELLNGQVDISGNMAPFIIIYDKYGKVVAGNGYLDGSIPQVPIGVLAASQGHKVNAVTWQPKDKVRIASVSVEANNYYVLGGRSLFVIEKKINSFMRWIAVLWLIKVIVLIALYKLFSNKPARPGKAKAPTE